MHTPGAQMSLPLILGSAPACCALWGYSTSQSLSFPPCLTVAVGMIKRDQGSEMASHLWALPKGWAWLSPLPQVGELRPRWGSDLPEARGDPRLPAERSSPFPGATCATPIAPRWCWCTGQRAAAPPAGKLSCCRRRAGTKEEPAGARRPGARRDPCNAELRLPRRGRRDSSPDRARRSGRGWGGGWVGNRGCSSPPTSPPPPARLSPTPAGKQVN